ERPVRISGFRKFLPTRASQRPFPFLVLFAALVISIAVTWALWRLIETAEKRFFAQSVEGAVQEVQRRVEAPVGTLVAVSSLNMSDQASYRNSFQEFLKHINLK